jgi:hypothetical protein
MRACLLRLPDACYRFALLALGGLEAPLNLPIKRDR